MTEILTITWGGIIAALGYVAKLLIELWQTSHERELNRRASLVELLSLLRAGRAAFLVQLKNRARLKSILLKRDSKFSKFMKEGHEKLLNAAYPSMNDAEKELHVLLRSITTGTIYPLNESLLQWVREDKYFKVQTKQNSLHAKLATELGKLEAHLLLWMAKYSVWMPDAPSHVFVYLDDEKKHGVGFPQELQSAVEKILNTY